MERNRRRRFRASISIPLRRSSSRTARALTLILEEEEGKGGETFEISGDEEEDGGQQQQQQQQGSSLPNVDAAGGGSAGVSRDRRNSRCDLVHNAFNSMVASIVACWACRREQPARRRSSVLDSYQTVGARRGKERVRQTIVQSLLYCVVYIVTYIWPLIVLIGFARRGVEAPGPLMVVSRTVYPAGGLLLMLVYTRVPALTVRRTRRRSQEDLQSSTSWIRAFWEVIKAGGEAPN